MVTSAHHNSFVARMVHVVKHCEKESTEVFTTLDTEMNLAESWDQEGLDLMCNKDDPCQEACEMERSNPS